MKKCRMGFYFRKSFVHLCYLSLVLIQSTVSFAQDGTAGINEANNKIRGYFDAGTNLMYAIGAIVGLVGALKVYINGMPVITIQERWLPPGLEAVYFW